MSERGDHLCTDLQSYFEEHKPTTTIRSAGCSAHHQRLSQDARTRGWPMETTQARSFRIYLYTYSVKRISRLEYSVLILRALEQCKRFPSQCIASVGNIRSAGVLQIMHMTVTRRDPGTLQRSSSSGDSAVDMCVDRLFLQRRGTKCLCLAAPPSSAPDDYSMRWVYS